MILDARLRLERARFVAIAVVCVLAASPGTEAAVAGPADQLKAVIDRVLRVLEDPALKPPAKRAERRRAIRRIADEIFDVDGMARRAMGQHWKPLTPEKQGQEVPVDYRMARRDDHWLIYDVSLIGNSRTQLNCILRTSCYGELVKGMRAKAEEPEAKP